MDIDLVNEALRFYLFAHTISSLIGAVLLAAIYFNIRRQYVDVLEEKDSYTRVDKGLLYLSLALVTWFLSGTMAYVFHAQSSESSLAFAIINNMLSIINSMFFLIAISYFRHAPRLLYQNERVIRRIIIIVAVVMITTLIITQWKGPQVSQNIAMHAIPDLLLSAFLCVILFISLFRTFLSRSLPIVAWLSVPIIAGVFISQLPEVFLALEDGFLNNLIMLTSKMSLIALFLVLATTWVIELAHTPRVQEMTIHFKDWSRIELSIPSKHIIRETLDFGSKTTQFKNLLKLAIRRKYATPDSQSIAVGNGGELSSQTYLTRIIDNLNAIGSFSGDQMIDRKDLLTFIGEGKYRLRMLPEHIDIDPALLKEFVELPDHNTYLHLLADNQ